MLGFLSKLEIGMIPSPQLTVLKNMGWQRRIASRLLRICWGAWGQQTRWEIGPNLQPTEVFFWCIRDDKDSWKNIFILFVGLKHVLLSILQLGWWKKMTRIFLNWLKTTSQTSSRWRNICPEDLLESYIALGEEEERKFGWMCHWDWAHISQ